MSKRISNYLKTYRKSSGLTQAELAFLFGCKSGTKVSRYERLSRNPNLKIAFACQVIFSIPPHKLFPLIFEKVEEETLKRTYLLSRKLNKSEGGPKITRKLEILKSLSSGKASESANNL